MRSAFVSHSTSDDSYVGEMESFLRAAGFDEVFNDVSAIEPDEKFWPKIEEGITNCESLVVVITFASSASEWVKREVEYARSLSKKIIPVWIEDCPIPPMFADRDVIDFRPRTRQERRFEISRIFRYAPAELIGREDETKLLNDAWEKVLRIEKGRPHVLTFVALGGEGKTSLVAKWVVDEMSAKDWPGCDAAFAWSFYSQGAREQVAASSDLFLKEALTFFGDDADKTFAASSAGAFEKGQRLARLVSQRRSLLILDGLEPLQYPTEAKAFKPGELKDQGVAKLLKDLASRSHGLCIVTTRIEVPDLQVFKGGAVIETHLKRLPRAAGVTLLKSLGVKGSERRNLPLKDGDEESEKVNEFEKLVEDVKGHALTLTLFGGFLKRAFHGDIRKRDRVKFEKADEKMDGGRAFRTMASYEQWLLLDGGDEGRREVAVLRLMGLFDRAADAGCLAALFRAPAIEGLTEPLIGVAEEDWNSSLELLASAKLLTVSPETVSLPSSIFPLPTSLDAHPLLREYFARQLRTRQPDAWRAAHGRLYEHLCATTPDNPQPTLEDLQPLYQAVAHGCQAGLQREACTRVYRDRILRGGGSNGFYSWKKLGAFGANLEALANFFDQPWNRICPDLPEFDQAFVLNETAIQLLALGRLTEATTPMRAATEMDAITQQWGAAAMCAGNLSDLNLTVGAVAAAVSDAEQCVIYADRGGSPHLRLSRREIFGTALLQAGRRAEAEAQFEQAEQMQAEYMPDYPLLCSTGGFRYCELLLTKSERAAWQIMLGGGERPFDRGPKQSGLGISLVFQDACHAVSKRAARTLDWWASHFTNASLLDFAIDHLTLGRAALYVAIFEGSDFRPLGSDLSHIDAAVSGLRRASYQDEIVLSLLTRAWLCFLTGERTGSEGAQADLDEAWEIAERGPMRLHMADIHLHRARLFFREAQYPWESPAADLAAAEKLINDCGYHRRDEELADAKAAILSR